MKTGTNRMEDGIMKKSLVFAVALFTLAACTWESSIDTPAGNMIVTARTETSAITRTIIEGETHVYWEPGDEIKVFAGGNSGKFITYISASSSIAEFHGALNVDEGADIWAVYPFSQDAVFSGETITTALPSKQVARSGSFGKDMNLAIAHSTTSDLQFFNVGGGVRFSLLQDGITEVVLEGLKGEALAGKVKVGFKDGKPIIQEVTDGKTSITITPPNGEAFKKNAWYYIVAIPGALENGFTFHFKKASDPSLVIPSSVYPKTVTIKRGIYGVLTYVDKGMNQTVSEDAITFQDPLVKSIVVKYFDTNNDGELSYHEAAVVISFLVDEIGTRADDGKESIFAGTGITSFDEMIYFTGLTRIDDSAFAGCTELTSVTIPENIESIGDNAFNGCTGLEFITITAETPPTIGTDAFANTGDCPIIVPQGAEEDYVEAWSEYEDRIQTTHYPEPEAIDLGLPSGLKWASFNLGATKPEEYGDYFAWGETEPKDAYSWSNYKWCIDGNNYAITKYCTDSQYGYNGFTDGETILNPEDDAAYANLGREWRMPMDAEWAELLSQCSLEWTTLNGVNGYRVTGPNGNSIFLPAAGSILNASVYSAESYCFFWSSSLDVPTPDSAMLAYFGSNEKGRDDASRYGGTPIRAVYGDLIIIPVESVSIDKTELELVVGESSDLVATLFPDNATIKDVIWSSNDDAVASVSSRGNVMGMMAGSAVISVTTIDGGKTATCSVTVKKYPAPEIIDMGLSVKWASFNLGASKPEEYGDYYAWGETDPYYYSLNPLICKEGKENGYDWSSYKWCMGNPQTLTKYCTNPSYGYNGFTDSKTVLDLEDDAAHVNLGEKWRIPTQDQWAELLDKCTWNWTQENGVNGWMVTSKLNGNFFFLPAAGILDRTNLFDDGQFGCFWSSSLCVDDADHLYDAWSVAGYSNGMGWEGDFRCGGIPVRPVYGDPVSIPVESVSIDKTELELAVRIKMTLVASVLPSYATDKSVSWSSSNESVATVSSTGVVTGIGVGTAVITVKTNDGGKIATCYITVSESTIPVPEAIDLDLPSGLKWASFNLGASKPEEYGDYYAWGEIEPYYICQDPLTWKLGKDAGYAWSSYKWCMGAIDTMIKYCSNSIYGYNGFTDDKTILDLEDDAAYVNLGGKWRMPTDDEWTELMDNCTWTWTTLNGVTGRRVTSRNGNSIFLPAAGFRDKTSIDDVSFVGLYRSSSLYTDIPLCAWFVDFHSDEVFKSYFSHCSGLSVRPVYAE